MAALKQIDWNDVNQLPVMGGGRLQGIPGRDNVIGLTRTLSELGA